jgi:hypothetical protein
MIRNIRKLLARLRAGWTTVDCSESDVAADPHIARNRTTGGRETERADSAATTGTGNNETFVGRVAGDDSGDGVETGAERRAQEAHQRPVSHTPSAPRAR